MIFFFFAFFKSFSVLQNKDVNISREAVGGKGGWTSMCIF